METEHRELVLKDSVACVEFILEHLFAISLWDGTVKLIEIRENQLTQKDVFVIKKDFKHNKSLVCLSLHYHENIDTLFAGYCDGSIIQFSDLKNYNLKAKMFYCQASESFNSYDAINCIGVFEK